MKTIYGMPVYESHLAQTLESGKPFARKHWMTGRSYYQRQVKKLAKRYGPLVYKPAIFKVKNPSTGVDSIIIHPSLAPQVRELLMQPNA